MSKSIQVQPLIAVRDVRASTGWYEKLLGLKRLGQSDHDHIYQRLLRGDDLILQLHSWEDEDHPNLVGRDAAPHGHGVLLWFEVDDFDAAVQRAKEMNVEVVLDTLINPNARHREFWIRDPDGYVVVLASHDGEVKR